MRSDGDVAYNDSYNVSNSYGIIFAVCEWAHYDACAITNIGGTIFDVDGVYGIFLRLRSPVLTHYTDASNMDPTGYCRDGTGIDTGISYGIPPNSGSLKEYDEICMNLDGFVIYCNITLSYGNKKSPCVDRDYDAYYVFPSGNVDYGSDNVYRYSYGINRQNK